MQNNFQKFKNTEVEINELKMSCLSNQKLENNNNFTKEGSYNLKQSQSLIQYKLQKLFENTTISKKYLENFVRKADFNKYINNYENILNDIISDFSKKIELVEENKNNYSKLLLSNIDSRKEKISKIENEANLINSKLIEISDFSKKNNESNNTFKQQIEIMEKDLINYNKIFEKIVLINNQIKCHQINII